MELVLHDLDEAVAAGLRRRADRHGRGVEAEAADILRAAVVDAAPVPGLGTQLADLFAGLNLTEAEYALFKAGTEAQRGAPTRLLDLGQD